MAPVKVFKKSAPNENLTVYMGKRSFIDCIDFCEPILGVILVDDAYLKGRNVYGQLTVTYKFGMEADEVMGVKFSKSLTLCQQLIYPMGKEKVEVTPMQINLLQKLGGNSYPFCVKFPVNAPNSVVMQTQDKTNEKPLGVSYTFQCYVAQHQQEPPHKRSLIELEIVKLQYSAESRGERIPSSFVTKEFHFSQGKINMELTLDRELYYHGEEVPVTIAIGNNSSKMIKSIKCSIIQHVEMTMINSSTKKKIASLETREGCPILPGLFFNKTFQLLPTHLSNTTKNGIALDGHTAHDRNVHLASSTMTAEGKPVEAIGIVVSYSVCVELDCGTLGGKLTNNVPLKLLNPAPGSATYERIRALKKQRKIERQGVNTGHKFNDVDD